MCIRDRKELCDISELLLGIECGGSDATSGIASNPAVGELSDLLVDLGASTIMSESIEWIGGEHVLAKRAATPEIHNQIIQVCKDYEAHLAGAGQDCRAGQPTPGNKAGGLSTLDEKSLGCIRKGGTRPIVDVSYTHLDVYKRQIMNSAASFLEEELSLIECADGSKAYQLQRLFEIDEVIRSSVNKRLKGKRHDITENWRAIVDKAFEGHQSTEFEERARTEKAAILKELAESRLSVLIGGAGTGKTTLLALLCKSPDVYKRQASSKISLLHR